MIRCLWLAVVLLFALPAALAQQRGADGLLVVPPLARVTDTTGALSAADRQALESKLAAFESARGSQIAILMVPATAPEPISDFAQRVGDAWKIGRAGVGDGLLIVVAKDERRVWMSVARTLEGAIPDLAAARVIRESITPRFKQGDFAGGLNAGLDAIFKLIEGEKLPAPAGVSQQKVEAGEDVFGLLIPFVIGGVIVGALLRKLFGVPGALLAGGGAGIAAGSILSSLLLGGLAGVAVFALALGAGSRSSRVLGGRRGRGGDIFIPGGWSGGGSSDGGGGGWSSGGGGDFSGGGAGGDW